jgi:hypothetical protein
MSRKRLFETFPRCLVAAMAAAPPERCAHYAASSTIKSFGNFQPTVRRCGVTVCTTLRLTSQGLAWTVLRRALVQVQPSIGHNIWSLVSRKEFQCASASVERHYPPAGWLAICHVYQRALLVLQRVPHWKRSTCLPELWICSKTKCACGLLHYVWAVRSALLIPTQRSYSSCTDVFLCAGSSRMIWIWNSCRRRFRAPNC